MANHQKDTKKVATKTPKQQGTAKVPKYAQQEAAINVGLASSMDKAATKKKNEHDLNILGILLTNDLDKQPIIQHANGKGTRKRISADWQASLITKRYTTMLDTTNQLASELNRIHTLLESPEFDQDFNETGSWEPAFSELIILVNELLGKVQRRGQRVDFYEGVGVHGIIQDITSLVSWLRANLPEASLDMSAYPDNLRFNRYFGRGTGYFANGAFFTGEYDGELAFFLDDQRIYLNRHIRRAVVEAEQYLQPVAVA